MKARLQEAHADEKRREEDKIRLAREKHSAVQDMEVEVGMSPCRTSFQIEYFSGILIHSNYVLTADGECFEGKEAGTEGGAEFVTSSTDDALSE